MNWSLLPPVCLAAGLACGLLFSARLAPHKGFTSKSAKGALQVSIVLLGFTVPLAEIGRAGADGFLLALGTIVGILLLGAALARLLGTPSRIAMLVAAGTAICGGSAIAALSPVVGATDDEVAASLATVFVLNALALFLFPFLGHAFGLSAAQFGTWAALAIHDTSSVVGAALAFDPASLPVATTVKLTRALWIAPLCLAAAILLRNQTAASSKAKGRLSWLPWFIPGFIAASFVRGFLPEGLTTWLGHAAKVGFALSLLFIGLGVNRSVFVRAGSRAIALGILLWIAAGVSTFFIVTL